MRKRFTKEFRAKVALEALKNDQTITELSSRFGVHASQIHAWKKTVVEGLPDLFSGKKEAGARDHEALVEDLYKGIGQMKIENDWLKKKLLM